MGSAVDFLHKKCRFAPRYTGGRCTIWEYRGGGGIHPVGATAVAYLYIAVIVSGFVV